MAYRIMIATLTILAAFALAGGAFAAESDIKSVTEDGVTVSYPPGLEARAQEILTLLKGPVKSSLDAHYQILTLLKDPDVLAKSITTMIGAEEKQGVAKNRLQAYKEKSEAMVQCFSHIRLVSKAEAVAAKGLDAGVLQTRYDEQSDEFEMGIDLSKVDADRLKSSYFPVFVNADGTIKGESKLPGKVEDVLGSNPTMAIASVHETVGYLLAQELRLYYPLSRWFNEGVSAWVTRTVVMKADAKLGQMANQVLDVTPRSKKLRDKVNLLAWTQAAFENPKQPGYEPEMEAAQIQYSMEVITQFVAKTSAKDVARIIAEVKYNNDADTDTICAVAKKLTGKDLKSILLGYVPDGIRGAVETGNAKKLVSQAETLVQEKKWQDAAAKLRQALQITPADVNSRLNLAWVEREFNQKLDSELQIFLAARLLKQQKYAVHLFASSIEGNYVCGRLAILLGNLEYAKKFLEPVLALKPNHSDAKRAMDELKTLEDAAKRPGG